MPTAELTCDETGCLDIWAMGLGFTCINRKVMEELAEQSHKFTSKNGELVSMIFKTGLDEEGVYRSEDMHFFKACRKLGYSVKADPTIELGHIGGREYRGRLLDALQRKPAERPLALAV